MPRTVVMTTAMKIRRKMKTRMNIKERKENVPAAAAQQMENLVLK